MLTKKSQKAHATEPQLAISVVAAAARIGISRSTIYPMLMDGTLPSLKLGRRRLIMLRDLESWLASLPKS